MNIGWVRHRLVVCLKWESSVPRLGRRGMSVEDGQPGGRPTGTQSGVLGRGGQKPDACKGKTAGAVAGDQGRGGCGNYVVNGWSLRIFTPSVNPSQQSAFCFEFITPPRSAEVKSPKKRIEMFGSSKRRQLAAFTIVEVMMAAVVMLAAIVGMMQVIVSGSEMLDVSRKQTIATQIIHSEIDRVRLNNWSQLSNGTTTITLADATTPNSTTARYTLAAYPELWTVLTKSRFTCTRVISDVRTDLKKIVFTVTWLGNTNRVVGSTNSRQYTRTGSTYFGKNGLYVTYQRS